MHSGDFTVISADAIRSVLADNPGLAMERVKDAYLAHHRGETVNPDSYFLRFPDEPRNRIIALPACIHGRPSVAGVKWISSWPGNVARNEPRASAVLILNELESGRPFACMEGAVISAARTAASAVLAAKHLSKEPGTAASIGFVGAGVISRAILDLFLAEGWRFGEIGVHDLDARAAQAFADQYRRDTGAVVHVRDGLERAIAADLVVFATSASVPYVLPPLAFRTGQLILNVSLRDIGPELVLACANVFDDVEHCLKADTSPHLAEQRVGDRRFVSGSLAEVILGERTVDRSKPIIHSPFGMGILDLSLGVAIYDAAIALGLGRRIDDFFG